MQNGLVWVPFLVLALHATADATTSDTLFIPRETVRWAGDDPAGGPRAASAAAASWTAGEEGRRAARNANVIWASLPVPGGGWRAPALLLEGASGTLEMWLNGRQVELPKVAGESSAVLRLVPLPRQAVGGRVELRLTSAGFPPALTAASVGEESALVKRLSKEGFGAVAGSLLVLALAGCALTAWLLTRQDRFPLRVFFFGLSASLMAYGLGPASDLYLGPETGRLALRVGVALFPWSVLSLVREGFPKQTPVAVPWILRGSLVWSALFVLGVWVESLGFVTQVTPLVFVVVVATCVLVAWRASRTGNIDGHLLAGGLSILLSVMAWDSTPLLGLRDPSGYHLHWSLIGMTAAFVGIFARRLMAAARTQRLQSQELERREKQGRELTARLLTDATELLSAVAQLRESSVSQNQVIEKQASALQETQVTAEEIKRTSALAADKARALLDQATVADEAGRSGEQAVEASLEGLSAISVEVSSMAKAMSAADELAREIGQIVDVVKELADQSNMLALNAAIEAVRSGEHGKGFAVVAREVRRLADQSLQSTVRIRDALGRLADGVRHAATAGQRGEQSVADTLERLRGSGEQLRTMSGILRETNASVRQISAAVTQQNAGIAQIFTAVEHLSEQMREALQRIQEAEAATLVVEGVASRMSETRNAA